MTDVDTAPLDAGDDPPPGAFHRTRLFEPWWLAVAATLFLALWLWREAGIRVGRESAQSQQAEINRLQQENELLTQQLEKVTGELTGLASAQVQTINLAGQSAASGASAKIFLDSKEGRLMAFFYNLPPTRKGTEYHLWITSSAPDAMDGGAFTVSRSGRASLVVEKVPADARSFAVTHGDAASAPLLQGSAR